MDIKISVIIPVYNMACYIRECLNSVLQQTLREIEIIMIDDGSTDGSLAVMAEYQKKYNNIKTIRQTNQGAGVARNNGIRHAVGKYIAMMDPDDFYPQNDSLEELYRTAEEKHVVMCGGVVIRNYNGVREVKRKGEVKEYFCNRKVKVDEYPYVGGHCRYLFQKDFLWDNNIFYPAYRRYQDPPFLLKAMLCAGEFYGINQEVYEYRVAYKDVKYTINCCIDVLCGIRDMFLLASENNLICLKTSLETIYENYTIARYKYSFCGNADIDNIIEEINLIIKKWSVVDRRLIVTEKNALEYKQSSVGEYRSFLSVLKEKKVVIYGAGTYAARFLRMYSDVAKNVAGLAVTKLSNLSQRVEGCQVKQIEEYTYCKETVYIIIAVDVQYHDEIESNLKRLNFHNILKADMKKLELGASLMKE